MRIASVLVLVGLLACKSSPDYIPEESAGTTLGGRTAAHYQIPNEANRQADVRIASFGVVDARTENGKGKVKALHVRLDVANEGTEEVLVDIRQQIAEGPDGARHLPGHAATNAGQPPEVVIAPGSSRTLDLFYEVRPEHADERNPKRFRLFWSVHVGGQQYAQSTPFHEVAVDPAIARQEAAEQLAYEWSDPYYGRWYVGPWYPWHPWW